MKRCLALALLLVLLAAMVAGCTSEGDSAEITQPREGPVGEADQAACAANRKAIEGAVQAYYGLEGVYPTSIQQLVPEYLQSVPSCPGGGSYTLTSDHKVICSVHGS
jgi:hypothetical protein